MSTERIKHLDAGADIVQRVVEDVRRLAELGQIKQLVCCMVLDDGKTKSAYALAEGGEVGPLIGALAIAQTALGFAVLHGGDNISEPSP